MRVFLKGVTYYSLWWYLSTTLVLVRLSRGIPGESSWFIG